VDRREFMKTPVQGALAASLLQGQPAEVCTGATKPPPNILFIMADQMTPFMLGPYSQKVAHTPNLDQLARAGTVFESTYCASPLCVPSRIGMFTGRLPHKTEGYDNGSEFAAHFPTYIHYLKRAGYRTAVAGKCHFIGSDQMHGFDERLTPDIYPATFSMLFDWRLGPVFNPGTSVEAQLRMLGPSKWTHQLGYDQMTFDRAMAWLGEYSLRPNPRPPVFLNVSFTQPHDPFTTTQEFLDLYKDADIPLPQDYGDIRRLSPTYEWFEIHHGINRVKLTPDRIREARRNYLGMISWVDDRVGKLLAELRRLQLDQDFVVFFASDHGEMLGEHHQWSKRLMLEWSSRVPLIVSAPGRLPEGKRVSTPVSLLDLFPTFAEVANVPIDTEVDGQSLLPLLHGQESSDARPVIAEYLGQGTIEPIRMVRWGQYKYITVNGYPPQLYDLQADPNETVNVAGRPERSSVEAQIRRFAEKDWDGPAIKKAVMKNQQDHLMIRSVKGDGIVPDWNYEPAETGPYDPLSDFVAKGYKP
jgi:choline-sulfatase